MGIILILLTVTVITAIVAVLTERSDFDIIPIIFGTLSTIFGIVLAVVIILAVVANISTDGFIESSKQRYNSLVYQLKNNLYDNDNDLGKKELYNQIQAWNEDLAKGKALQNDFWLGAFYPDVYDQFDFIE